MTLELTEANESIVDQMQGEDEGKLCPTGESCILQTERCEIGEVSIQLTSCNKE
jgi:hypothetical protein